MKEVCSKVHWVCGVRSRYSKVDLGTSWKNNCRVKRVGKHSRFDSGVDLIYPSKTGHLEIVHFWI